MRVMRRSGDTLPGDVIAQFTKKAGENLEKIPFPGFGNGVGDIWGVKI